MGVGASSAEVEAAIKELGVAYEPYAMVASENAVDGKLLGEYQSKKLSVEALFADLELQPPKKLHTTRLEVLWKDAALEKATPSHVTQRVETVEHKELDFADKLGEGVAGMVFRGTWHGGAVAIKVLKAQDEGHIKEFDHEASVNELLGNHNNVVPFVGVCLSPRRCIVLQYMPGNSMEHMLIHSKRFLGVVGTEVLQMLVDAAAAVLHMHAKHILHCDLAARNFLVGANLRVCICDFGLSKHGEGQAWPNYGPVAWMAPEALAEGVYSKATDVYMFGVFLWEVLARRAPYGDVGQGETDYYTTVGDQQQPANQPVSLVEDYGDYKYTEGTGTDRLGEIAKAIKQGKKLPLDESWPGALRAVLKDCWRNRAHLRPTMAQIHARLADLLAEMQQQQQAPRAEPSDNKVSPQVVCVFAFA